MRLRARVFEASERVRRSAGRRRFRAALRGDDVLVVGFPRSGNTWLGFMLANALAPERHGDLTLATFGALVPDVNDEYFWGRGSLERHASLPSPRFFRVHATYDPAFPRVVYVVRDPRDVLVSHYHLQRLEKPEFDFSLREFVLRGAYWPAPWDEHVRGWLVREDLLLVRYEDLHADPARELARVLSHAGLELRAEAVDAAVAAARFERMRSLEDRFGDSVPRPGAGSGERLVRKGRVGGWRDELDEEAAARLQARFAPLLERLGYASDS